MSKLRFGILDNCTKSRPWLPRRWNQQQQHSSVTPGNMFYGK